MYIRKSDRPLFVKDHNGRMISRSDLPPPETQRWVAGRKALVVAAVNGEMLTFDEACEIYGLSAEELETWCASMKQHGPNALRVTAMQRYRTGP